MSSGWQGGVIEKHIPLYDTYAKQIEWLDNVRIIKKDGLKLMEATCTKCNKWFIPEVTQVWQRLKYIKGQQNHESGFYCSDVCKSNCEIFNQKKWPKDKKPRKAYNYKEFNTEELRCWRNVVLKQGNYICEYCGEYGNIAHHILPKKLEPFYALDTSNGIVCCEECHYKYGHRDECGTWNLARIKCK